MSVGEEELSLPLSSPNENGITIIKGINEDEGGIANGVGKSCIGDAIYFALFGVTMRDIPKKQMIINRINKKMCSVTLGLKIKTNTNEDDFVITRSLSPNGLTIIKNGVDVSLHSIPESNSYLCEELSLTQNIVQNCIIMRANNTVPFMCMGKVERKNFIENVFNLDLIQKMYKKVRAENNEERKKLSNISVLIEEIENNCKKYKGIIDELEENFKKRVEVANLKRNEIKNSIELKSNDIEKLKERIKDVPSIEESIKKKEKIENGLSELRKMGKKVSNFLAILNSDYNKIKNNPKVCPTCNRAFDDEHVKNVEKEKNELLYKIDKLRNNEKEIETKLSKLNEAMKLLDNKIWDNQRMSNEQVSIKHDIDIKENQIQELKKLYQTIKVDDDDSSIISFKKLFNESKESLTLKSKEKEDSFSKVQKYNMCEHILSDEGVKPFIISKLIEFINARIAYYLQAFKSRFVFNFDEKFDETMIDSNGNVCSYFNCSGAETKKIDLAISLSISDVMRIQNGIDYNIMMFDEILDSSIDNKSMEIIMEKIANMAHIQNRNIMIITHKNDVVLPEIKRTIILEKINNFTNLKEIVFSDYSFID